MVGWRRLVGGVRARLRGSGDFGEMLGAADHLPIDPDLDPDDPGEPSKGHVRAAGERSRLVPPILLAIAAGGFIGAWGRYEVGLAWPVAPGTFPVPTFLINTSGAFVLGLVLTAVLERLRPSRLAKLLRFFAGVGILGAWTTMSTMVVEGDLLVKGGHALVALAYVGATLACGLLATTAGIAIGRSRSAAQLQAATAAALARAAGVLATAEAPDIARMPEATDLSGVAE